MSLLQKELFSKLMKNENTKEKINKYQIWQRRSPIPQFKNKAVFPPFFYLQVSICLSKNHVVSIAPKETVYKVNRRFVEKQKLQVLKMAMAVRSLTETEEEVAEAVELSGPLLIGKLEVTKIVCCIKINKIYILIY